MDLAYALIRMIVLFDRMLAVVQLSSDSQFDIRMIHIFRDFVWFYSAILNLFDWPSVAFANLASLFCGSAWPCSCHVGAEGTLLELYIKKVSRYRFFLQPWPWQDILAAGPPCQPYSRLSTARSLASYNPFANNKDTRPLLEFCRHVRDRKPKTWVLEEASAPTFFSSSPLKLSFVPNLVFGWPTDSGLLHE